MGIMDIFKNNKNLNQNDNDSVAFSTKKEKNEKNYETHINALHDKGIPLSQAILKLSQMEGFSNNEVLNTFSIKNESFEGGVVHYFNDDTVLLQKGSNLISNRKVKEFAKKESLLECADKLFKLPVENDRLELTEELFTDLESLENEILEKEENLIEEDRIELEAPVSQLNIEDELFEKHLDLVEDITDEAVLETESEVIDAPKKKHSMQLKTETDTIKEERTIEAEKSDSPERKKRRSSFALKR